MGEFKGPICRGQAVKQVKTIASLWSMSTHDVCYSK